MNMDSASTQSFCASEHDNAHGSFISDPKHSSASSREQESSSSLPSPGRANLRKRTIVHLKPRRELKIDDEILKMFRLEEGESHQVKEMAHFPRNFEMEPLTRLAQKEDDAVQESTALKNKVYERMYARTGQTKEPEVLSPIEKLAFLFVTPYEVDEEQKRLAEESTLLSAYSAVYTCAKLVAFACFRFGISLDWSPREILFHIQKAEKVLAEGSMPDVVGAIEDLYYVLYARVIAELGNIYACKGNHTDEDDPPAPRPNDLPEPMFMLDMFNTFKRVLESEEVCKTLDKAIVKCFRQPYINQAIDEHATEIFNKEPEVFQYYEKVRAVLQPEEPVPSHGLHVVCRVVPDAIFEVVGEKFSNMRLPAYYVTPAERVYRASIIPFDPEEDLPHYDYTAFSDKDREFVGPDEIGDDTWERHTILSHRAGSLAKLEGKSIGEVRRDDDDTPVALMQYVKERRCICTSQCSCAKTCTNDPERFCPHAPKQMTVLCSKQPLENITEICDMMAEIGVTRLFKIKDTYRQQDDMMDETVLDAVDRFKFVLMEHRNVMQYRAKSARYDDPYSD